MKIKSLLVKNFKGFSERSIEFHPNITALIGNNGSGKTSILEGLALLLNRTLPNPSNAKQLIFKKEYYIKNGTFETSIAMKFSSDIYGEESEIVFATPKPNGYIIRSSSPRGNFSEKRRELAHQLTSKVHLENLPLVAFYKTERIVRDLLERLRGKHEFDQKSVYGDCLNAPINFRLFFEWFRSEDDFQNEQIVKAKNFNYRNKKLEIVRNAIEKFTGFTNLQIKRRPLNMQLNKSKETLNVNLLSQGELSYLALVGDIAKRLVILNDHMDKPLEGKGVILIDEVELHLHPQWQSQILMRLLDTFPNCQFITTTHSPIVLSHLKKENIVILDDIALPEEIYGKTSNDILTQVMGTPERPLEIQNLLDEIYKDVSIENLDAIKNQYHILKEKLVDDAELTGLEAIINRLQWKKDNS